MRRARIAGTRWLAFLLPFLLSPAVSAVAPVNDNGTGTAISGYDVVAYFEDAAPRKGDRALRHDWKGATWWFATGAHRDAFASDPERYAPQYGGYCAYAVAHGGTAKVDPQAWKVRDGKLYLNLSKRIQARWEQDIPGFIERANRNWPELLAE